MPSKQDSAPVVDVPGVIELANEQVDNGNEAMQDYIDAKIEVLKARLDSMDEATKVLSETVNRTPTSIQRESQQIKELSNEKFSSIQLQFKERDTRQERESRDNRIAVDAAFAAQKESALKQDESNQKAIDKAERVTTDAINKLQDAFKTSNEVLQSQLNDLKLSQGQIIATKTGGVENQQTTRNSQQDARANVTILISIVLFIFSVIGFVLTIVNK